MVEPVADRLDASRGRARTDRDEACVVRAQADDLLGLLRRADRALDEQHVERAGRAARRRLGELDDVEALGDREQLVLEVEEGQLAAVARGELDDADPRPVGRRARGSRRGGPDGRVHHSPSRPKAVPSSATENTGPSRQTKNGPSWQWPHVPDAARHVPLERQPRAARGSTPRPTEHVATVACIIRSGPQMNAVRASAVPGGAGRTAGSRSPTRPSHSGPARSTVSATSRSAAAGEAAISATNSRSRGVRAPRKSRTAPNAIAVGEDCVDERAERREADAAGDDDDVPPGRLPRPASHGRAGRAAPTSRRARAGQRGGRRTGRADRQLECHPGRIREIEIGGAAKAGSSTITNWPGRAAEQAASSAVASRA